MAVFFYRAFLVYRKQASIFGQYVDETGQRTPAANGNLHKQVEEMRADLAHIASDLQALTNTYPARSEFSAQEVQAIQRLLVTTQGKLLQAENLIGQTNRDYIESQAEIRSHTDEIARLNQQAQAREARILDLKDKLKLANLQIVQARTVDDSDESLLPPGGKR